MKRRISKKKLRTIGHIHATKILEDITKTNESDFTDALKYSMGPVAANQRYAQTFRFATREQYEARITVLERENRQLQLKIDDLIVNNLNDNTAMHLKVVKHHRDELLTEVEKLKKLLGKKK